MRRRTLFAVWLLAVFLMVLICPVLTYASPFAYFTELNNDNIQVMGGSTPYSQGASIPVSSGCQPGGITVHPATSRAYVSCFTGGVGTGTVSVINTLSNTVDGSPIPVGTGPNGIAVTADGSNIYVANYFSNTVSVFNTQTRIEAQNSPVSVGTHPTGVAIGTNSQGTFAYITNYGSGGAGTVTVINTLNNQEVSSGSPITVGRGPFGIALNTAGTLAYVANSLDSTVSVIQTETASVIKTITLAPPSSGSDTPEGIAVGTDGTVYVTNYDAGTVSVLDAANNYAETTIDVGSSSGPIGIDVNAAGTLVYVGNRRGFTMSVIDAVAKAQVPNSPFSVGAAPWSFGKFIQSTLPTLTTTSPLSNITSNAATANGNITDDGGAPVSAEGVCYATTTNPVLGGTGVTCVPATPSGGIGTFSVSITGLTPGQTYHAQAYATNVAGTSYGGDVAFAALAIAPTVSTSPVTAITSTTATGNGNITSTGGDQISAEGVCYATTANPVLGGTGVTCVPATPSGGIGTFSVSITGLTPGQIYRLQAYATSTAGTSYGGDVQLQAEEVAPAVTTNAATAITSTTATGNGDITSTGGDEISAEGVCYATTANPVSGGTGVTCLPATPSGGTGIFSVSITGLTPGQTYHVQAYAANGEGTSYGGDVQFAAVEVAPAVTTNAATAITSTTATGNGNITSTGGSEISAEGVCYATTANPVSGGTGVTCLPATPSGGTGTFSVGITGLTPGQTYHVQAYAANTVGRTYGGDVAFAAVAAAPSVSTSPATAITSTTATGNGNITSTGGSAISAEGVCYATTVNPVSGGTGVTCLPAAPSGGTGTFSVNITGLTSGQTYHMQAYATNTAGTSYGGDVALTTLAVPTVSTSPATAITSTTATGNGNITSTGGSAISAEGVCYATTANPVSGGTGVTCLPAAPSGGTGTFSVNITGLTSGQTYHMQAYATNTIGTSYGGDVALTTLAVPAVSTSPATAITSTTATGNGNITSTGGSAISAEGVCYATTANPVSGGTGVTCLPATPSGGTGTFSVNITGLTPGQTYHMQAYAANTVGTSYGGDVAFAALAAAPTVTTNAVTAITSTTATGNGNITSTGGSAISAEGVCYATTANPVSGGTGVTCSPATPSGGTGTFSVNITGLTPGQTYHMQAFATNTAGTSYGGDVAFAALAVAPTVTTNAATAITSTTATGNGNITSTGGSAISAEGVCYATTANPVSGGTGVTCLPATPSGGTGTFSVNITGLTPGQTYHMRAFATNTAGTSYGGDVAFAALAAAPTVTTNAVTAITSTTATGNGNITSTGGSAISAEGVCYATTANPVSGGTGVTCLPATPSGGTGTFSVNITGLTPGQTYHMQAFATNTAGTSYGNDVTFAAIVTTTKIGVFRNGNWYLDFPGTGAWIGCGTSPTTDRCYGFGMSSDVPVSGDWNASGFSKIGIFRSGNWYLDLNGDGTWDTGDTAFGFGEAGDIPVVGDWSGSGTAKIGVFRNGTWYLDFPGTGVWVGCGTSPTTDRCFSFGEAGDIPVVGDWSGSGTAKIGVFRNGNWYLDFPGTGAWVGCGTSPTTDRCFSFGEAGDIPVVGDWSGSGTPKIGLFRNGTWYLDFPGTGAWVGCGTSPTTDRCFGFGEAGDIPVVGDWNGQ